MTHPPNTLTATLARLNTDRDPTALNYIATSAWSYSTRSARADLRVALRLRATSRTVTDELRVASDEQYDELLQWCIRTLDDDQR